MKSSLWGYWFIAMGIFVMAIVMLVQSYTTTNTQDYYLIKEVTNASLVDSIDYAYYRVYGVLKINREKFVENFIRRYAETVTLGKTYKIDFYDLYEIPPKVSVKVSTTSDSYYIAGNAAEFDVVNKIDSILEMDSTSA